MYKQTWYTCTDVLEINKLLTINMLKKVLKKVQYIKLKEKVQKQNVTIYIDIFHFFLFFVLQIFKIIDFIVFVKWSKNKENKWFLH